jgi:hypothetical protein
MVSPRDYAQIFQLNAQGKAIFDDLTSRFYDIRSYTRGEPDHTIFLEGNREVIAYIITQITRASKGDDNGEIQT